MNATRLLQRLAAVNQALKNTQYISPEQRKVYRKTKARLNRMLKEFINPAAPPRPLPQPLHRQQSLFPSNQINHP